MRVNEKSLIEFAASKDGVDKEGFLYKKGELNRGFQKRWFVLKGNLLFYFEKRDDKQPTGVIVLEDCNVEVCATTERHSFSITFAAGASPRSYVLSSDTEGVMEDWMKAVTFAPYDYTRTIVRELQKRVSKLRSNDLPPAEKGVTTVSVTNENGTDGNRTPSTNEGLVFEATHFEDNASTRISPRNRRVDNFSNRVSNPAYGTADMANLRVQDSDGKAKQTLQGIIRRTKSSENLHQIHQINDRASSRSPLFKRRVREYQSMKRNVNTTSREGMENNLLDVLYSENGTTPISTFQFLHEAYGTAIWTRVKPYEESYVTYP